MGLRNPEGERVGPWLARRREQPREQKQRTSTAKTSETMGNTSHVIPPLPPALVSSQVTLKGIRALSRGLGIPRRSVRATGTYPPVDSSGTHPVFPADVVVPAVGHGPNPEPPGSFLWAGFGWTRPSVEVETAWVVDHAGGSAREAKGCSTVLQVGPGAFNVPPSVSVFTLRNQGAVGVVVSTLLSVGSCSEDSGWSVPWTSVLWTSGSWQPQLLWHVSCSRLSSVLSPAWEARPRGIDSDEGVAR